MVTSEKKYAYIILFSFIALASFWTIRYRMRLNAIKKEHIQTIALVYKVHALQTKYNGVTVYYTYYVNSKKYYNDELYTNMKKNISNDFVGLKFDVLYLKSNPKNSKILINQDDYDFFDMPCPYSSKSLEKYFY